MTDRVPLYPGRVKLVPVSGQSNTYDMSRADQPTQEGTPLNKATFLKDSTATAFGLSTDAVPDDVFSYLGKYAQYWWKRRKITYSFGLQNSGIIYLSTSYANPNTIQYSDSVDVSSGTPALVNASDLIINSSSKPQCEATLPGKYITKTSVGDAGYPDDYVYYLPEDCTFEVYIYSYIRVYNAKKVYVEKVFGDLEYVQSPDRSSYPDSGEQDGYEYQYLGVPFENAAGPFVQIETGSYVGTGTYGGNNKNSLTFGIEPLVVMVCQSDSSSYASFLNPCKKSAGYQNYGLSNLTWSDKSLSWNNQYNADYQLNSSNRTYYYIAFGF